MDRWIHNVVTNNIRKGKIVESDAEIYEYGYTLMVEKIMIFAVSVIIALLLNAVWEVLALCITFIPLRVYSGGYHAKSRWGCMVMSGLFVTFWSIGIKLLSQQIDMLTFLIIEVVCICIVRRFAPVGTAQKQILASEEDYYKKKVITIVSFELLIGLLCFHFGFVSMITSILLSNVCNVVSILGQIYCDGFKMASAENFKDL